MGPKGRSKRGKEPTRARVSEVAKRGAAWRYVAIALAGFMVRFVYLLEWRKSPLASVLLGDARAYDDWAQRIAAGDWRGGEVFFQAPLYPYLLGAFYTVVGRDLFTVRSLQALLGALTCVLVARAGRQWFSDRVGWIAGLLFAFYGPALLYEGLLQKAALGAALTAGLMVALGAWRERPAPRWAMVSGVLLGAFILTRENAMILIPVLGVWWVTEQESKQWRQRWLPVGAFGLGLLLLLGPAALRNKIVGGELLLTTSNAGTNFYIGNHAEASGRYVPLREGRGDPRYERDDARELAEVALGRSLSAREVSRYWMGQGLEWVRSAPGAWARLSLYKLWLIWHRHEWVDFDALGAYRDSSWILDVLSRIMNFGLLVPLAALGVWLTRSRRLWVLYAILAAWSVSIAAFFVLGRYRYPLVPVLAIFASAGLVTVVDRWRAGERKPLVVAAVLAVLAGVAANWPIPRIPDPRALTYYSMGIALAQENHPDEALAQLQRALTIAPKFREARLRLGHLYFLRGDLDAAGRAYRDVLALAPREADAHAGLALVAGARGDREGAYRHSRDALAADPGHVDAHINLANMLIREGQLDEAIDHYLQAAQRRSRDADLRVTLGTLRLAAKEPAEAMTEYESALRLRPGDELALLGQANALRALGRRREAIKTLELLTPLPETQPTDQQVQAMNLLAGDLATCREPDLRDAVRARELAENLARSAHADHPEVLDTRAAALAANGRFQDAVKLAERVGDARPSLQLQTRVRERLELYRRGEAVRVNCEGVAP